MASSRLIAHRGYSAKYPENTLASIEAALDAGAKYIEFDLQMIEDNEFILMHDDNLRRCCGINKSVFSLSRQTLRNYDAGFFDKFSAQFNGIKIPLLENVVSLFKQFPDAVAIVEIKEDSFKQYGIDQVMKHLVPLLEDIKERCYIISFNAKAIECITTHTSFKTGFVLPKYNNDYRSIAEQINPALLICNYRKLPEFNTDGLLPEDALWPGDWDWALYEIDEAELAHRYFQSGVTYIETNQIEIMLQHPLLHHQSEDKLVSS